MSIRGRPIIGAERMENFPGNNERKARSRAYIHIERGEMRETFAVIKLISCFAAVQKQ